MKVPRECCRGSCAASTRPARTCYSRTSSRAHRTGCFRAWRSSRHDVFRVTRNADSRSPTRPTTCWRQSRACSAAPIGEVVRLEVVDATSHELRAQLDGVLRRRARRDVYSRGARCELGDLWQLARPRLRATADPAATSPRPAAVRRAEREHLRDDRRARHPVHHPYEWFEATVVRFVEEAAERPATCWRSRRRCTAPRRLARRAGAGRGGRERQAGGRIVELKARFDEERTSSGRGRSSTPACTSSTGCRAQDAREDRCRRPPRGRGAPHYVHFGTGNYNATTARLYTDLGLLTADPGSATTSPTCSTC